MNSKSGPKTAFALLSIALLFVPKSAIMGTAQSRDTLCDGVLTVQLVANKIEEGTDIHLVGLILAITEI